jgi:hypothetical protein
MIIRKAAIERDYDGVWEIFLHVISGGDVFSFEPNTPKASGIKDWDWWMPTLCSKTYKRHWQT